MRSKRSNPAANPYIDVEAAVQEETDSEEEEDEDIQDGFIDDTNVEELHRHQLTQPLTGEQLEGEADENEGESERLSDAEDDYYRQLLEKAYDRSRLGHHADLQLRYGRELRPTEAITLRPGIDDYPLWRVACRIGFEEIAIASLLGSANCTTHRLRSAFTRGAIRGCIYLECEMNPELVRLLESTPGIALANQSIKCRRIDFEDSLALLTMQSVNAHFKRGQWVQITKGTYKGDVGLVSAAYSVGVDVLLVPRLQDHLTGSQQKRKASAIKPPQKIFNPADVHPSSGTKLIQRRDGSYALGRFHFVHGLLQKTYGYHSIASEVYTMPWSLFSMFLTCRHPDVDASHMPRPREWVFGLGDKVVIRRSDKRGNVEAFVKGGVQVDCQEIGIFQFNWQDVLKDVAIGDFVSVAGGEHSGYSGWVVEKNDDLNVVKVLDKVIHDRLAKDADCIEAHVNCVALADPPFQHASSSTPSTHYSNYSKRHPWCGTDVVISKLGHARKGDPFQVANVLFDQPNPSGLRLELQYSRITPYTSGTSSQHIIVQYEDVVEASSGRTLEEFFSTGYRRDSAAIALAAQRNVRPTNHDGSFTPMPTGSTPSTPAWDPSSRTPLGISTLAASPMHSGQAQEIAGACEPSAGSRDAQVDPPTQPQHVLLNDSLANVDLWAVVNGGEFNQKSLVVTVSCREGRLGIFFTKRNTTLLLNPEWVTPKHPNPGYDNALLVVIKGEQRGKYVRRVHHRHADPVAFMTLVVMNYAEDLTESLTEEILELSIDFLAIVKQPNDVKDRNRDVTQALRTSYRTRKKNCS